MEDIYDSESSSGRQKHGDESDGDAHLLAEHEITTLRDENKRLAREVNVMKAQVASAVGVTAKMDEIHAKNMKIAAALRSLQSDKDDVLHRLEIAQRANDEMSNELVVERENAAQRHRQLLAEKESDIEKIRASLEGELQKTTESLKRSEMIREKSEVRGRQLDIVVEHIVQNAGQYFGRSFNGIDAVNDVLSKPHIAVASPIEKSLCESSQGELAKAKAKVKRAGQKVKGARDECARYAKELERLRKEAVDRERREAATAKASALKRAEEDEERGAKMAENAELITALTSKNHALSEDCKLLKGTVKEMAEKQRSVEMRPTCDEWKRPPPVERRDPTRPLQEKIEELKETVAETTNLLKQSELKKREVAQSLEVSEKQTTKLEIELGKCKSELAALHVVQTESANEIKCLRESLHAKEASEAARREIRLSKRLKSRVSHLEKTLKSHENEIQELSLANERDRQKCDDLENRGRQMKSELEESRQKCAVLTNDLAVARTELHEKPAVTVEDVMPSHAWRTGDFDSTLNQQIAVIGADSIIQPISKLSQIYRTIAKHYKKLFDDKDKMVKETSDDMQNVRDVIESVLVDSSLALSMQVITLDELIMRHGGQRLIDQIRQTMSLLETAQRGDYKFNAMCEHMQQLFGESSDVFAQTSDLKQLLDERGECLKRMNGKNRELKGRMKGLKRSTDEEISKLTEETSDLEYALSELKQEHEMMSDAFVKTKKDLHTTRRELKDLDALSKEGFAKQELAYENAVERIKADNDTERARVDDQLQLLHGDLSKANDVIAENELTMSKLKRTVQHTQKALRDSEQNAQEIQTAADRDKEQLQIRLVREREDLVDSYERAVDELRQQCNGHRNDLETVSKALSDAKGLNTRAKKTITQLKHERCKLEDEIAAMHERIQREQDINRATMKQNALASEASAAQKMQDTKASFESDKRRIFAFVADEFRTLFNVTESMNEGSFRTLVSKVKSELRRLTASDAVIRRLVGAGPRDTTDGAVAGIVLS